MPNEGLAFLISEYVKRYSASEALAIQLEAELSSELANRSIPMFNCKICLEDRPKNGSFELECEHRFCEDCIRGYVTGKIGDRKVEDTNLFCPDESCVVPLSFDLIRGCTDHIVHDRYLQFKTDNVVEELLRSGMFMRCPNSACSSVFEWAPPRESGYPFHCNTGMWGMELDVYWY